MSANAVSSSTAIAPRAAARRRLGVWHLADPKITLASVASMIVGASAAAYTGTIAWPWLSLTVAGIFLLEAAKNASGEIFDWDSGTDRAVTEDERTPFSGGKRVIVDGLLTRRETVAVAAAFYALGIAAGLVIAVAREPSVLWLGAAGVALAYFYHAPPLSLSYRGLGELAVALSYGPLIACGTYLVQRGAIDAAVVLPSIPLGLAIMAFLWINEFPDARADAQAGKRTLVVRLGRARAARAFGAILAIAWLALWLLPLAGLPMTVWLGAIGMPHAVAAVRRLQSAYDRPAELVCAQAWTLLSFVLMAAGTGLGLIIA